MDRNVLDTGVDLAGVHFPGRHGSPDTLWVHSRCSHTVPCHQWALLPLKWWSLCFRPAVQSIVLSPSYALYVVVCWRTVPWPPSGATLTHPHLTEMTSNLSRINILYSLCVLLWCSAVGKYVTTLYHNFLTCTVKQEMLACRKFRVWPHEYPHTPIYCRYTDKHLPASRCFELCYNLNLKSKWIACNKKLQECHVAKRGW